MTLEDLIAQQDATAIEMQKAFANLKKTPKERRTLDYYSKKSKELDELWREFERVDYTIRNDAGAKEDHPYFDLHTSMGQKYFDAHEDIQRIIKQLTIATNPLPENVPTTASGNSTDDTTPSDAPTDAFNSSSSNILVKRQQSIIATITQMLGKLLEDNVEHTHQYIASKLRQVDHHFNTVQQLHDRICLEDFEYDVVEYSTTLELLEGKLLQVQERQARLASEPSTNQQGYPAQSMPMVKIPTFDGDYLKWRQFFDLFSEMVHKKQMPNIQKMWYLKTNLSGEAEKLIRHLSLTEDNYTTAWTTLQNRYNNLRILTTTILDKLIGQQKLSENPSSAAIKSLHDTSSESLSALNNLKIDTSTWDPILINILVKKLDKGTHMLYEQSLTCPRELPSLMQFLSFLETRFQSMEAVGIKERPSSSKACTSIATSNTKERKCSYCRDKTHPIFRCQSFKSLSIDGRLEFLKTNKLCINCLKPGHLAKNCSARNCFKCPEKHNTLVHGSTDSKFVNLASSSSSPQSSSLIATHNKGYVLLSTAVVKLIASNGQAVECRALLDSGSQVNLISEKVAKQLGLSLKPASLQIEGIGHGRREAHNRVSVQMKSRVGNYSTQLEAFVLPHIMSQQPTHQLDTSKWFLPNNLMLADPKFNLPGKIDVLIGAELYYNLLAAGQIKLNEGLPTFQNTVFGWVLAGKVVNNNSSSATCTICVGEEPDLQQSVERFWQLEVVKATNNVQTTAEKNCEAHFSFNTTRNNDGRFVVKIPFAEHTSLLGESKQIATNRFYSLERRLAKDAILMTQYVQFMDEYEALGHMTKIDEKSLKLPLYFIPHHSVTKSTKLRVVFDASAKTSTGLALNDLMYTGPTIQNELFSTLVRFRKPRFVFTSDIEKMYRQILIDEDDRKYQLIVWRSDINDDLHYYQLNTVTYGTRSAPYLATKCLQQLSKENTLKYPLGAKVLLEDFYVDDCLTGSDDLQTASESQQQLTELLLEGGFRLRKWCANHPKLLQSIPAEDQEVNLDFDNNENNAIKTLGLTWLPKADMLCIKINLTNHPHTTKRTIVSDVAKIFDPLGLLAPVVVTAKILIQQLWQIKLSWDEDIPTELLNKWLKFRDNLIQLNNAQVPRHMSHGKIQCSVQLHTFCDASEKAYGAAVYIRSTCPTGSTSVQLLCAKSRVAPLKMQTIPRLELCAALLGAQLLTRVKEDLKMNNAPAVLWTDSQVVLAWIQSASTSFHTFVANRIAQIQELSSPNQWRHVTSRDNPADILSRGLPPSELISSRLWLNGPPFLQQPFKNWPTSNIKIENEGVLERKQPPRTANITIQTEDIIRNINHRNSFSTLVRIMAYVRRFVEHTRTSRENRATDVNITPLEKQKALNIIMRNMQKASFIEDIDSLTKHQRVNTTSKLNSMHPFLDNEGVIRVGGRLEAANMSYDAKHPVVLPYNDPLTKLLAIEVHKEHLHCGPLALLAHLRQHFWPIKGKSLARSTVQNCVRCIRVKPKLLQQLMGNLPARRVQPSRPFINSGVDFCGPFWIHFKGRGRRPHKAYLAVFCCFSTKAIHLEIVSDLTTEAFIGCLKRFIGRRGHCLNLYCDNATNFVGANNQLQELREVVHTAHAASRISRICSNKGINFNFIPPRSPHFGGLWEAAVKSAKNLFVKSVASASLTYEELETVMVEIEAVLNSRPLSPMSADPNDLSALTPGHFLIGEPMTCQIDPIAESNNASLLTRWKLVSHIKHQFWKQWSRDYLNELQNRGKWKTSSENIKEDQLVIVKEDNTPPLQWPLGRIEKTYKGEDNLIRVADIRTATGICKRPIHRLAPLPMQENCENPEPTPKVKRGQQLVRPTILLALLLLLPLVIGIPVTIEKFRETAGIHFQKVGIVNLVSSEWTLVVFYDLGPLQLEMQALSNGTKTLQHVCQQLPKRTACEDIVTQFEQINTELAIDNSLLSPHRQKRGAVNIVGNIANSLFGVLDSEYAAEMSDKITAIHNEENLLLNLLKNQTSIIDSTINIVKGNQLETSKTMSSFENKLSETINRVRSNEKDNYNDKIGQVFLQLSIQLTMMSFNIQRIQSSIINVLTDTHHGQISPLLLSPRQLDTEIAKTTAHLPRTMRIAGYQGNLLSIYKLMTVQAGITSQHVIFKITVPLTGSDEFNVYEMISIPTLVNQTMMAIKISTPLLAINLHRDRYFPTSLDALQQCTILEDDTYICLNRQPIYSKGATPSACEVSLFNNESQPLCSFMKADEQVWIQTHQRNQWIFALSNPIQMTAVCGTQVSHISLSGSGFIRLEPDCIMKHEFLTIKSNKIWSSTTNGSYTSFVGIHNLEKHAELHPLSPEPVYKPANFSTQIEELTALQKSLTSIELQQFPSQGSHHHHSLIIAYTALGLVIALVSAIIYYKCRRSVRTTPQPMPRAMKTELDEEEVFETTFSRC